MKQRWECRCTMDGEKIIRLISGNTAGRAARRCLTSEWVGSEKGPSGSWATLQVSFKATVTALTIRWVENRSFMPRAGRIIWRAFLFGVKAEVADLAL